MADLFLTEDVQKLLLNKYVVIMGDSVQRACYKDLVLALQSNRYLTDNEQRKKGERVFNGDKLLAGGILQKMTNDTVYREVREYRTNHFLVQFYFLTRCYDDNVKGILDRITDPASPDGKVDIFLMNSCMWDVTRYGPKAPAQYPEKMEELCRHFKKKMPSEAMVIWATTLPVAEKVKGGFLIPEVEFLQDTLRLEVMLANATAVQIVLEAGYDVLDLHFFMRRQLHRRHADGIHWDWTAHRRITNLLLTHISEAWGKPLPGRLQKLLTEKHGEITDVPSEDANVVQVKMEPVEEKDSKEDVKRPSGAPDGSATPVNPKKRKIMKARRLNRNFTSKVT